MKNNEKILYCHEDLKNSVTMFNDSELKQIAKNVGDSVSDLATALFGEMILKDTWIKLSF